MASKGQKLLIYRHMLQPKQDYEELIKDLKTKSDKIRMLARAGYSRTEISKILHIRYQHVRKVLVDAGIKDGMAIQKLIMAVPLPPARERKQFHEEILLRSGFQYIGDWQQAAEGILSLNGKAPRLPGVYALVLDDIIVYIGLTLDGLQTRMDQYRRGHKGQKTSARVKRLICESLAAGKRVKVMVATPDPLEWNGLPVNGAAGLEAGLIDMIRPAWNIRGSR